MMPYDVNRKHGIYYVYIYGRDSKRCIEWGGTERYKLPGPKLQWVPNAMPDLMAPYTEYRVHPQLRWCMGNFIKLQETNKSSMTSCVLLSLCA